MNETIKETKSNEQVVAGELVVPAERDSKGVYKGHGRASKVDEVIEKFGDKMILDLASRKRGIKSSGARVADWGNSNGVPICYATGRRVVKKLIADGRLAIKEESRNDCLWKVVALP